MAQCRPFLNLPFSKKELHTLIRSIGDAPIDDRRYVHTLIRSCIRSCLWPYTFYAGADPEIFGGGCVIWNYVEC